MRAGTWRWILLASIIASIIAFGAMIVFGPDLSDQKNGTLRAVIGVLINVVAVLSNGQSQQVSYPTPTKDDPMP